MAGRMTVTIKMDTCTDKSVVYDVDYEICEGFKEEFESDPPPSDLRLLMTALTFAVVGCYRRSEMPMEKFLKELGRDVIGAACMPRGNDEGE